MRSNKPEAREFQRWVTAEVLPTIRKTGGYMVPAMAQQAVESPMELIAAALRMSRDFHVEFAGMIQ